MTAIQLDSKWLEACLALDETSLGGFWSSAQWRRELEDDRRICLGLVRNQALIGVACGWLAEARSHLSNQAPPRGAAGAQPQACSGALSSPRRASGREASERAFDTGSLESGWLESTSRLTPAEVLSFAKENGFDNAKQVRQGRRRGLGGEEALQ